MRRRNSGEKPVARIWLLQKVMKLDQLQLKKPTADIVAGRLQVVDWTVAKRCR